MYTQPDEYIPSAEALARNFLIGGLICERYDRKMEIGYFPDSFGQASQIPQILNGFGIDKAVFWRGLCDKQLTKTEFIWQSTDGSKVTTIWMPFSYGNAYMMPADKDGIVEFTKRALDSLGNMATTDNILFMRGWDHSGFSPEVEEILRIVNEEPSLEGHKMIHSNLDVLFEAIQKEHPKLQTLAGEFREPKTMRIHPGIDSSRTDLKQLNRKCQTLLEKFVEPVCALNWTLGSTYPQAMINQSWKYILQSQAHDSMCGCCTDQAAKDVRHRFMNALDIEEPLLMRAASVYAGYQKTNEQAGIPILAINPLPYQRTSLARAEVVIPFKEFDLFDPSGEIIPYQVISKEKVQLGIDPSVEAMRVDKEEAKKDLLEEVGRRPDDPSIYYNNENYVPLSPRAKGIEGQRVVFFFPVSRIPGCGSQVVYLNKKVKNDSINIETGVQTSKKHMENEFLRVDFRQNGSIDLTDKSNQTVYKGLHIFEDGGDAGDTYNYSPPFNEKILTSSNLEPKITCLDAGPLIGRFQIDLTMDVPKGLSKDGQSRSKKTVPMKITTIVSLSKDSRVLEFSTKINNQPADHRVRVLFPAGISCDHSYAEEQFGIIKRPNKRETEKYWQEEEWTEKPLPLYPMQTFVFIKNDNKGLAFLNKEVTEYEIVGKKDATIAATLFRGIGAMGRPNLVIRPGRASGLEVETPDALIHGELEFHYAVTPLTDKEDKVAYHANCLNAPLMAVQTSKHAGAPAQAALEIELQPESLCFTSLKKAEREDALILRFYNSSDHVVKNGKLRLGEPFGSVELANLNEESLPEEKLPGKDGVWDLPAVKSNQILTLKIKAKTKQKAG